MDVLASLTPERRRLLAAALLLVGALVLLGPRLVRAPVLRAHTDRGPARAGAPPGRGARRGRAAPPRGGEGAGAGRRPGLYRFAAGARVATALAAAGGATAHADITLVNLAAPLADGEQIVVPERGAVAGAAAASSGAASSPAAPLDLNRAAA